MRVAILGAGVAGLACALEFARRAVDVVVLERAAEGSAPRPQQCSWFAGGMLAPWCERESCGERVALLGAEGLSWWQEHFPGTALRGTLVVAHARDTAELVQFARRTRNYRRVDAPAIAALEPQLAQRFAAGLYFPDEGHLDPRAACDVLRRRLRELGVTLSFGASPSSAQLSGRVLVDCTGLAARTTLGDLRGVKGEMLILRPREPLITRPVRVLHPRMPVYVVPRADGTCMVGATMIESDDTSVSARSVLELLSAAYAVHPAFGEAGLLEVGAAARPAFPDNQPRLRWRDGTLYVNGLYRHGFLLAPSLARRAVQAVLEGTYFPEVMDEDDPSPRQRRLA
ncbi:MAG: FAD-dependent oxidoreductase [Proteobacteria bacterium]|nr:FAD-dependent oxidoreductase [Pseudomonadota bacterium]